MGHIITIIAHHKALVLMFALTFADAAQTHHYQQQFRGLPPAGVAYYHRGLQYVSPGRPCDLNPLIGCHPSGWEVTPDAAIALVLSIRHVHHSKAVVWGVIGEEAAAVTWNLATSTNIPNYPKPDGTVQQIVKAGP